MSAACRTGPGRGGGGGAAMLMPACAGIVCRVDSSAERGRPASGDKPPPVDGEPLRSVAAHDLQPPREVTAPAAVGRPPAPETRHTLCIWPDCRDPSAAAVLQRLAAALFGGMTAARPAEIAQLPEVAAATSLFCYANDGLQARSPFPGRTCH